jgi:hypothetical protein
MKHERDTIVALKRGWPRGTRIRLLSLDDSHYGPSAEARGLRAGMTGEVTLVDDAGTVHVQWSNGSNLGLIWGLDEWQMIT